MHDNLRSQKLAYSAPRFTLMARPRQDVESRFWSKVEKTDSCWIWRGTLDSDGFGVFKLPKATNGEWWAPWSGTNVQAHIFSALFADFRFADGHYLRHICNNRACVNVAHLESCAPVDVQPSGVDVTNTDKKYWEGVLRRNKLSMAEGMHQKLFYQGHKGRVERDNLDDNDDSQPRSKRAPLTATAAFRELYRQAEQVTRQLPTPPPAPKTPPPQPEEVPWRGMAYENRVRKLDKKP